MVQQKAHSWVENLTRVSAGLALGAALFLCAADASAANRVKGEYANTKQPIRNVGELNSELSHLCRRGLFKQRKLLRLSIGFIGPNGQGVTGVAQKGWNLYDPTGAAEAERTYHFFNQGFSNCRVYVAVTPKVDRDGDLDNSGR